MHWLVIIALAVFVFGQGRAIRRLEQRLDAALRATEEHRRRSQPAAAPTVPHPEPAAPPASLAAARPASRVRTPPAPPATESPARPRAPAAPRPKGPGLSTWLAENGLAWIGGGGLALGGLLLVVYAAQQGVFTPPLRIAAAVAVGGLMVAASEWILRRPRDAGQRHLLAAAVAAGAGAVTLYGAACAAYALYALIPFPTAAALTAIISLGLLGLSLRHGEPLALLAVFGAAITPLVTGLDSWPPSLLQAYVLFIGVTGLAMSAVRLWSRACFVSVAGLLAWSLGLGGEGAALVLTAAFGPFLATLRMRAAAAGVLDDPRRLAFLRQPSIALALASLAAIPLWFGQAHLESLPVGAAVSAALVALGAAMIALGRAPAAVYVAPVGASVLAALLALVLHGASPGFSGRLPWIYGLAGLIPVATLAGAVLSPGGARTTLLDVGGVGVAVLVSLAWLLLDGLGVRLAWLPPAILGGAMFAGAGLLVRRTALAPESRSLALWLAAAAESSYLAVHAASPASLEPVAFAAAALILAAGAGRLGGPGLAKASVAGGLLAAAALFHPGFMAAGLAGQLSPFFILTASGAAAALLFAGGRALRASSRGEGEALDTAALMVLVAGLFTGLHRVLTGADAAAAAGALFEGSVRTLVLLAAGLLLTLRQREDDGPIARWRTRLVIAAGVAHGLLVQGLIWNPWWGGGAPPVGLPLLNTLLLAYLAPGALLAACAWRRRPADGWARAWAAAAAAFGFLWALLALRNLFQGADMGALGVGRAELGAYALLLLATARLLALEPTGGSGRSAWLKAAATPVRWAALAFTAAALGYFASPWWGPMTAPVESVGAALLLFALYGAGAAGLADLGRTPGRLGQAARAGAAGVLFVLLTLAIRWTFHGGAMGGDSPGGGLETWTFSALWAAFGLAALSLGTVRRDIVLRWAGLAVLLITAVKVVMFDLARLEGVIRAASFLAVGALLLAGALAARRLNAPGTAPPSAADGDAP